MSIFLFLSNNYDVKLIPILQSPWNSVEGHSEGVIRGVILAGKHKGMVAGDFVPPIRRFHLVPRRTTSTCVVDKVGRLCYTLGNKESAPCGFICVPLSLLL